MPAILDTDLGVFVGAVMGLLVTASLIARDFAGTHRIDRDVVVELPRLHEAPERRAA